ncbi:hypothetical protein IWX48DRAFT_88783 [Phyllosticta citricarpa]
MGRHTMVPTHPNMIFLFYNIFFASIFSFFSAVVLPIGMTIRTRSQRRPSRQGDKEIRKPGNQETKIETKRKATPHPHLFLLFVCFLKSSFSESSGATERPTKQINQSINRLFLRCAILPSCRAASAGLATCQSRVNSNEYCHHLGHFWTDGDTQDPKGEELFSVY